MLHRKVPHEFKYANQLILVEKKNGVAIVTMNNPPMNLNSIESMLEMREDFRLLEYDPEARVIVLTGSGTRAFNVGSDLKELEHMTGDYKGKKFKMEGDLTHTVESIPKPTICAIEGYCMGGGLELACCCDIRYASEASIFSQPEINLALVPGSGGLFRLPKLIGVSRALEMIYTGDSINAEEAYRIGLVNKLFPKGTVLENAVKLAKHIAEHPPKPLRVAKAFVQEHAFKPNEDCYYKNLAYVDDVWEDQNAFEGAQAFLEKRPAKFIFSEEEKL